MASTAADDTIFALATPPGTAALAVIRLSGIRTQEIVSALAGRVPEPRKATLLALRDPVSIEVIDRAIVTWFPSPNSFTGEDSAEFSIHGSKAVVARLIDALGAFPATRISTRGEFSRRALENGKMNLIEVESLADLISAETEQQRKLGIASLSGKFQTVVNGWREQLLAMAVAIEGSLDFSDEDDVLLYENAFIVQTTEHLLSSMSRYIATHARGEILRSGLTVLISGPPNAGKSTLLNELSCREIAIVSDLPGTTRDLIEVRLDLNGYLVNLVDSAGIRSSSDKIEAIGVTRAIERSRTADLILWLCDRREIVPPPAEFAGMAVWRLYTKCDSGREESLDDRAAKADDVTLPISVHSGYHVDELLRRMENFVATSFTAGDDHIAVNERQRLALQRAVAALKGLGGAVSIPEVVAMRLREAIFELEGLIGKIGVEDVLDGIFSRFCIGK
ncbi:tRNA modification GTPase trmE [Rhodoblastus acidophilus]|uniref:tRNA modification GTPase MnmE n=1 Tax=Rhodoblastus acidophilus TaxID=1074 RepID=A0A212S4N0_RHOAC|nr:tRNA uridine-5-carboxymethylaminomethyl(34) synthesis GTPase MnmE [Rhodoblastus acidophilus]PPQ37734.1 tRNA uridine-5-carboxymethylaminomethyl(34) synthesis GTPase MnmE [Rhodoblastus acidophilus]RAI23946.1 tRNA uridine-5-carboxymethylaminomethyl(34) synthesis GTPase MnmE [Rhodoblastus acidophilus]SNB80143.1 tRNA modification GTPase trmE [Rhodoblastus acidophilus]